MNYSIYTDGACSGNGKENAAGGFAFIIIDNEGTLKYEYAMPVENATNNICELSAVFGACSFFDAYTPKEDTATIYSDSAYIINCITQNGIRNGKLMAGATQRKNQSQIVSFGSVSFLILKIHVFLLRR